MTPDRFTAWLEEHGPRLQHQFRDQRALHGVSTTRASVEDAWQTVMLRLCSSKERIQALDEARLPGYLYQACLKEMAQQRRGREREERRLKALALLDGRAYATDAEQVECERVLRALPKGPLRTAAWLIYVCEWSLEDAATCVGLTSKTFKRGWRSKAYRQARSQLAQFVRRTRR